MSHQVTRYSSLIVSSDSTALDLGRCVLVICLLACSSTTSISYAQEFNGPLKGWADVRRDFHAAGDGVHDDTAALQRAFDVIGTGTNAHVLYLPAGQYKITNTLLLGQRRGIAVLGDDPRKTSIVWHGPKGIAMVRLNGVQHARFGRVTWDGRGLASIAVDHGWDSKHPFPGTHFEHADEVFRDVDFGIVGGSSGFQDAETTVLRCEFVRCGSAGLSVRNFNALDWFIWDSHFVDCRQGVTNQGGAGHFHVFNSTFERSRDADISIGNLNYFSFRRNVSIGSNAFLKTAQYSSGALITLQGNRIIDTVEPVAIRIANLGPIVLVDNEIRSRGNSGPCVVVQGPSATQADVISIGNKFTIANAVSAAGRFTTIDDHVVASSAITAPATLAVIFAERRVRPVVDVDPGAGAPGIQAAIAKAQTMGTGLKLVHLPAATYKIDHTIVVPANNEIAIVGDAAVATVLQWVGPADGVLLRLDGPSRGSIQDIMLNGDHKAIGLELQKGASGHVTLDEDSVEDHDGLGIWMHNFAGIEVQARSLYLGSENQLNVRVDGAGTTLAVFGGAACNSDAIADVQSGAKLLIEDLWYEGHDKHDRFFNLSGAGSFTLSGSMVSLPQAAMAALMIDRFHGRVSLVAVELGSLTSSRTRVEVAPAADTDVLALGVSSLTDNSFFTTSATGNAGHVGFLHGRRNTHTGSLTVAASGSHDASFVREMLSDMRSTIPRIGDATGGAVNVVLTRVYAAKAKIGFHFHE